MWMCQRAGAENDEYRLTKEYQMPKPELVILARNDL